MVRQEEPHVEGPHRPDGALPDPFVNEQVGIRKYPLMNIFITFETVFLTWVVGGHSVPT
jgi:hypothetical protein